jgi:hypothetical protein
MIELNKMINLKAAFAGAATLTVLSGFISESAHAFKFKFFASPNEIEYKFVLDTDNPTSPISELEIFSTDTGELIFEDFNLPLNNEISTRDRSEIEDNFDEYNNDDTLISPDAELFEYTIPVNQIINYEDTSGIEQTLDLGFVGFIAPSKVEIDGVTFTVPNFSNLEESLAFFASKEIKLPTVIDDSFGFDGFEVTPVNDVAVPEADTTLGILSLLGFGIASTMKRKNAAKAK